MKKFLLCFVLLFIAPTMALAAWTDDFLQIRERDGLDNAVEDALHNGISPQEILIFVENNKNINEDMTLRALYCSGSDPNQVSRAAAEIGVKKKRIEKVLKKSVAECGTELAIDHRIDSKIFASPANP